VIARQRPLKTDKLIDHDGDYSFPEGKEYFKYEVKKSDVDNVSKAKQETLEVAHDKKAQ
jgi:Holliday junction resolvase RusA-like endonuclease